MRLSARPAEEENAWLRILIEREAGSLEPELGKHPSLSVKIARPAGHDRFEGGALEAWVNGKRAGPVRVCARWLTVELSSAVLPVEIVIRSF